MTNIFKTSFIEHHGKVVLNCEALALLYPGEMGFAHTPAGSLILAGSALGAAENAVGSALSYLISTNLSSFICKMEITIIPTFFFSIAETKAWYARQALTTEPSPLPFVQIF